MEFSTARLEGAAQIKEYPSGNANRERKFRPQRLQQKSSAEDEDDLLVSHENEAHQLDDLV